MNEPRTLLYLHGAAGPDSEDWLHALNGGLKLLRLPHIQGDFDFVVRPNYQPAVLALQQGHQQSPRLTEPPLTWRQPKDVAQAEAALAYALRQRNVGEALAIDPNRRGARRWGWVPADVAASGPLSAFGVNFLGPVRAYQHDSQVRWAVQKSVLSQVPKTGSVTIIAHSLGSVVAVDILKMLPPTLEVSLLLTIGSPLAIRKLGHFEFGDRFPFDRVHSWVNLYDPGDLVTTGRGIAKRLPQALDVPVNVGSSHSAAAYLSSPAAAAAIGSLTTPSAPPHTHSDGRTVVRRLHPSWSTLMLSFAYGAQLSAVVGVDKWHFKLRMDAARRVLAARTTESIEARRGDLTSSGAPGLDSSPLGEGRCPTTNDLIDHAAGLITEEWSDADLLALVIGLTVQPPFAPFDVEIGDDLRNKALIRTLNRVRCRDSALSDQEFADAVRQAVKVGREVVRKWGLADVAPWVLGAGLTLLTLTGVGVLVAAPAGLAGAALVTATLAAFGPGGMVGGIVTIAALTGVGAAAAGVGTAATEAEETSREERSRQIAAQDLAGMPLPSLRGQLAALLAVVEAQSRLSFESSAPILKASLATALNLVDLDCSVHQAIAPGRPGTKELREKSELLRSAMRWLDEHALKDDRLRRAQENLRDLPASLPAAEMLALSSASPVHEIGGDAT